MQVFVPGPDGYRAFPLERPVPLGPGGMFLAGGSVGAGESPPQAWIVPDRGPKRIVLFTRNGDLRVNGRAPLPLMALVRGDELRLDGVSIFVTDEDPLRVVEFNPVPPGARPAECGRCHRTLRSGEPVVFCPVCGLPYMAQPDKDPNCWTFGPCLGCKRDPKVEFVWRPEEETGGPLLRHRLARHQPDIMPPGTVAPGTVAPGTVAPRRSLPEADGRTT